jgi:mRNA-degrading endonuclease RelE of RelBE toxin-antitoxin system
MVDVKFDSKFQSAITKIKDAEVHKSVKNKISKIIENPEVGKPMRNIRKGTREVYVGHYRLSYAYYKDINLIEFLEFYHKDEQ